MINNYFSEYRLIYRTENIRWTANDSTDEFSGIVRDLSPAGGLPDEVMDEMGHDVFDGTVDWFKNAFRRTIDWGKDRVRDLASVATLGVIKPSSAVKARSLATRSDAFQVLAA